MSDNERRRYDGPREADLEKALGPQFREYEERREAETAASPAVSKQKPKKLLNKTDLLFVLIGFLAVFLWQSCKAAGGS